MIKLFLFACSRFLIEKCNYKTRHGESEKKLMESRFDHENIFSLDFLIIVQFI